MSDDDLDPSASALLDLVRSGTPSDDERIARNRHALSRKLGIAASITAVTTVKSAWGGVSIAVGALLAVAVGTAGAWALTRSPKPAPSYLSPPVPVPAPVPAPSYAPVVVEPSAAPTAASTPAPKPQRVVVPPPSAVPAPKEDDLAGERALLAAGQRSLSDGHPSAALAIFERYAAEYPFGQMSLEGAVGRALCLCTLHREDAANEAAKVLARGPSAALAARIRAACSIDAGP